MENKGIGMVAVIVVIAVVAAAAVGGYVVMSGEEPATDNANGGDTTGGDTTDGDTTDGDTTDGDTTDNQTDGATSWTPYSFDNVYYKYSISSSQGDGYAIWDVTDVSGDEITVSIDIEVGQYSATGTVTGEKDKIHVSATSPVLSSLLSQSFYAPWMTNFAGGNLIDGNSWSVTYDGTEYTAEVDGTETYVGQEGYVVKVIIDGDTEFKGVVSENMGFPLYVKAGDPGTDEDWIEAELVDFSS